MSQGLLEAALICREPNAIGEALRALTFPGHGVDGGVGCYTDFEVRADAVALDAGQRAALVALSLYAPEDLSQLTDLEIPAEDAEQVLEDNADACGYAFTLGELRVEVAWFWDGDGWLCFRVFGPEGFRCGVVNSDCKKAHNWRAFSLPHPLPGAPASALEVRCSVCAMPWPVGEGMASDPGALVLSARRPGRGEQALLRLCQPCAVRLLHAVPALAGGLEAGAS